MPQKAFISDLTYRTKEQQIKDICAFYDCRPEDLAIYDGPEEIPHMLRPSTRRNGHSSICMVSLAVLADKKSDFIDIAKQLNATNVKIVCIDDQRITGHHKASEWRRAWQDARRRGAAKAGGDATANKSEKNFWERFAIIKDRWHLSEPSEQLLREASIRHHDTVRSYLTYTRWEWRRLTDTKRERILEKQYRKPKAA